MNYTKRRKNNSLENTYYVLKINFGIFLLYSIFLSIANGKNAIIIAPLAIFIHAFILFVLGCFISFSDENMGGSMILAAVLLVGIGFSFCVGVSNNFI